MDLDALTAISADQLTPEKKANILQNVEREIEAFDVWFQVPIDQGGCGEERLVKPERALLRTYLVARMSGRFPSVLKD
jgi:hypothetical protein